MESCVADSNRLVCAENLKNFENDPNPIEPNRTQKFYSHFPAAFSRTPLGSSSVGHGNRTEGYGNLKPLQSVRAWSDSGLYALSILAVVFRYALFERRPIHIFIIDIRGRGFTHGHKPLRAIRRHPDDVAGSNRVPVGI